MGTAEAKRHVGSAARAPRVNQLSECGRVMGSFGYTVAAWPALDPAVGAPNRTRVTRSAPMRPASRRPLRRDLARSALTRANPKTHPVAGIARGGSIKITKLRPRVCQAPDLQAQ